MTGGGYANVLENVVIDLPEQVHVNFVDLEDIAVLPRPIDSSQLRISLIA
jgi:hypothetical protein